MGGGGGVSKLYSTVYKKEETWVPSLNRGASASTVLDEKNRE